MQLFNTWFDQGMKHTAPLLRRSGVDQPPFTTVSTFACWEGNRRALYRRIISVTAACSVALAASAGTVGDIGVVLASVKFRIVSDNNQGPLANRELLVFDGRVEDAHAEFVKTKAIAQPHYLTSVKTDNEGRFTLALPNKQPMDILIQPGPPYGVIRFETASDIAHTKSPFHVRVVRFDKETHKVARNDIYDLLKLTVQQISLDGTTTEHPFKDILLVSPHLPPSTR
jgi:hypothetical protein